MGTWNSRVMTSMRSSASSAGPASWRAGAAASGLTCSDIAFLLVGLAVGLAVRHDERPVARHNLFAQRHQGYRNELKVGDGQRDTDDGDGHGERRDHMPDRNPDAGHKQP